MIYQPQISNLESELAEIQIEYNTLSSNYDVLNSDYLPLQQNYTLLQNSYEELKSSSFTYYTVDDRLQIFDVELGYSYGGMNGVRGKIKNVGDTIIKEVYVLILIRQPDGTFYYPLGFMHQAELTNLYPNEINEFTCDMASVDRGELEILLIY